MVSNYCCGDLASKFPAGAVTAAAVLVPDVGVAADGAAGVAGVGAFCCEGGREVCGTATDGNGGRGAETPAISEPSPSFCKLGASSLPVGSMPFAD